MARSRIEIVGDAVENQSDADLAARAAAGDREAFEELYRRHSRTAMRVAYRVTGNIHDASDAVSDAFARVMQALPAGRLAEPNRFRSYLLTSTRHAAVDVLRRAGRAVPSGDDAEPAQTAAGPPEVLIDRADNALVAAAFRALPERWRSVLWLTEVEGIPAREAAGMLGVSANGVAQLAVRARAGLRERYLQAHLPVVEGECRDAVSRLGAYVGGALAVRDLSRVDQHLAACDDCRSRETELREIGTTLRRAAMPLPLGVAGLGARWLRRATETVTSFFQSGGEAVAGAAAAAVFVASVASVGVVSQRADGATTPAAQKPAASAPAGAAAAKPAATPAVSSSQSAAVSTSPSTTTAAAMPKKTRATTTTTTTQAPAVSRATRPSGGELAAPAPSTTTSSTTTTTTGPPAPAREEPTIVDAIEDVVDVPSVPTTLPTIPPVDEVLGEVVGEVAEFLPFDVLTMQSLIGAVDEATLVLMLAGADEPLPSPEAPGLPV